MGRDSDTSFAGRQSSEEVSFNAMFSGVSLQSILTEETPMPLYGDSSLEDSPIGFPVNSSTTTPSFSFSFFNDNFLALNRDQLGRDLDDDNHRLGPLKFKEFSENNELKLKLPKIEPFQYDELAGSTQTQPFNLLTSSISDIKHSSPFSHLPPLHSLGHFHHQEHAEAQVFPYVPPSKRIRLDSVTSNPETLESIVESCCRYHLNVPKLKRPAVLSSCQAVMPQSKLARRRRQKLSEKTQSLRKLMPWDTKMDMATMLEEAHKYVRFLQAQLIALETMPSDTSSSFSAITAGQNFYDGVFGGLGNLNRNQILQVLVNSPVAQTMLYSKGCCVFSVEQLGLLRKIAEGKALSQHQQQNAVFDTDPSTYSSRVCFSP